MSNNTFEPPPRHGDAGLHGCEVCGALRFSRHEIDCPHNTCFAADACRAGGVSVSSDFRGAIAKLREIGGWKEGRPPTFREQMEERYGSWEEYQRQAGEGDQ
ncbi:hypothetical protein RSO41_06005 [Halomonas sp. I1]|uniref:hypothetical protein n=1 Tax=Halomonas sp. I1 TaxID=393536 RepID=UPI0028DDB0DE|nr:hypothetical protein [Halomonas sp. I1]MDT8894203.1 hypothetical protein [Halomonas sp. I1]